MDIDDAIAQAMSGINLDDATPLADEEVAELEDEVVVEDESETSDEEVTEDEDSETDEETEDDSEEDETDDTPLELTPEMTVVIDGKEVKVADALELKADYTRKTQALADERKALEAESEKFSKEIGEYNSLIEALERNPVEVVAGFVRGSRDAKKAFVELLVDLSKDETIPSDFVEALGYSEQDVQALKAQAKEEARIAALEARLAEQDRIADEAKAAQETTAAQQALIAQYDAQWDNIVRLNPEVEQLPDQELYDLKVELLEYSREKDGMALDDAYEILAARKARAEQASAKRAAEVAAKKQKLSAVAPKSATSSAPAKTTRKPGDLDAAIKEAMSQMNSKGISF